MKTQLIVGNTPVGVDWEWLRIQKATLVELSANRNVFNPAVLANLDGLVSLLDALQDAAADALGEKTVFGSVKRRRSKQRI